MLLSAFPSYWYNPNVVGRMTREAADERVKASLRRGRVRWGRHFVREGREPGGNRLALVFRFLQIDAVFPITIFSLERK